MQLQEKYKAYPIKFYENPDGTIYYENVFLEGTGKTLVDAMKQVSKKNLSWDVPYYYDDVLDIEIGSFIPALKDRKVKGRKYLGKIDLKMEIEPKMARENNIHSITHIAKHREDIPKHDAYVKQMKREEAVDKFIGKLKDGLSQVARKIAGVFKKDYQYEMFFPVKTRKDLICNHCGSIIPTGSYYEEYRRENYHLECMWDKLCNGKNSNEYELARKYFLKLQKFVGKWPPNGLDIEEDYLADLELVKVNDRKIN